MKVVLFGDKECNNRLITKKCFCNVDVVTNCDETNISWGG